MTILLISLLKGQLCQQAIFSAIAASRFYRGQCRLSRGKCLGNKAHRTVVKMKVQLYD